MPTQLISYLQDTGFGLYSMREWLSGGAPPCQGGGRGFDPRLALEKRTIPNRYRSFFRAQSWARKFDIYAPLRSAQAEVPPDLVRRLALLSNRNICVWPYSGRHNISGFAFFYIFYSTMICNMPFSSSVTIVPPNSPFSYFLNNILFSAIRYS